MEIVVASGWLTAEALNKFVELGPVKVESGWRVDGLAFAMDSAPLWLIPWIMQGRQELVVFAYTFPVSSDAFGHLMSMISAWPNLEVEEVLQPQPMERAWLKWQTAPKRPPLHLKKGR